MGDTHDRRTNRAPLQPDRDVFVVAPGPLARRFRHVSSARRRREARRSLIGAEEALDERRRAVLRTIEQRSFETHFQPIVDLRSRTPVGAEALSRFSADPTRAPDAWFAEAAAVGLGVELELAAVDMALGSLDRLPRDVYLSLNASVEAVVSEEIAAVLDDIPAERIVLELTEHTPVTDYGRLLRSLEELRRNGVRLAVDDAGSGFSSLQHILNLKPDIIKLDIALTRGIDRDPARRALGRALLAFGLDAYDATLVAEGIETDGELETLRALGCPIGQGFYLGRPTRMVAGGRAPVESLALVAGSKGEAHRLRPPGRASTFVGAAAEVAARMATGDPQPKTA